MSEAYPGDEYLTDTFVEDAEIGVELPDTDDYPWFLAIQKTNWILLLALRLTNKLRVFDEGSLDVGVRTGKFWDGSTLRTYAASSGNTLADDKAHIYIYINSAGTLVITEYAAFPDHKDEFHIRLADVTTSSGDITGIVDCRGQNLWNMPVTGGSCANVGAAGGVTFVLTATLAAGSTVQIHNANAPFKYRVTDAWSVAKSADGGTWKLTDGTDDITDVVTVTGTDKTIDRAGTIDDAKHEIAASGSLSVVGDGANADVEVYVLCVRVA